MVTQTKTNDPAELFGNVIHSYTRAQAIEDGVLIDVTETARKQAVNTRLKLISGPGDDGELVVTIMLPQED